MKTLISISILTLSLTAATPKAVTIHGKTSVAIPANCAVSASGFQFVKINCKDGKSYHTQDGKVWLRDVAAETRQGKKRDRNNQ